MLKYVWLILCLCGCVSINTLPQSLAEVDFQKKGKTGLARHEEIYHLKVIDDEIVYNAAKAGLLHAGFQIRYEDLEKRFVLGEHGMTAFDWNVVAGIYIKKSKDGNWIKVVVQGSKDVGIMGDKTGSDWPSDIFQGMKKYIAEESDMN